MKDKFIIPNYQQEDNFIDLVDTLYKRIGIDVPNSYHSLDSYIPKNKHYLFVLCDGMGSNIVDKLEPNSILRKNKVKDLITVFPSTTGCVLTSLATGLFPSDHGIWGWFNYNKKNNLNYYPILFLRREDHKNINNIGIKKQDIFKRPSLLKKKCDYQINILFSKFIINSDYSKFVGFNKDRHSYENDLDILRFMQKECQKKKKSYTYLYLSDIDSLEHHNGIDSPIVVDRLHEIESLLTELSKIKDLTIVVTADHGQVNVQKKVIFDYDKYEKYFYAKPSIDCGTMSYYVKEGEMDNFYQEFTKEYPECALCKTEDLEKEGYFKKKLSKYARESLGNFISVSKKDYYMLSGDLEEKDEVLKGNHSGLQEGEMIIPLIVINNTEI